MKITVVGAGFYGSTTVQRIAEGGYADDVVMIDIVEGKPQGLALDMMQSRSVLGFETRIIGSNDYEASANSDICVITAGLPRKPGMSRMDLLEVNAKIIGDVTRKLVASSPNAVYVVVSNPLDEMTALCAKIAAKEAGVPANKVMGQAGMLDTARFKHFVAEVAGCSPMQVEAMTLGSHGETMVPVPSLVTVNDRPLESVVKADEIASIVQRTRDGGAEIVGLLKTGSAYYAPSAAAAKMVEAVVKNAKTQMPVCAWVSGEYGLDGVYLGVPAIIGAQGVEKVVELKLAPAEVEELKSAAEAVRSKQADIDQFV